MSPTVLHQDDAGIDGSPGPDLVVGAVAAAVVDHDDLVRDTLAGQAFADAVKGGSDVAGLVTRRNDDGELHAPRSEPIPAISPRMSSSDRPICHSG